MNIFLSAYVGGVLYGLINIKKLEKFDKMDLLFLLCWPMYAILTVAELIFVNSATIVSKINSLVGKLTLVVDWLKTKLN